MKPEMSKSEKFPEKKKIGIKEELKEVLDTRRELVRKALGPWAVEISKFTSDPEDEWTAVGIKAQINYVKEKERRNPENAAGPKKDLRGRIEKLSDSKLKKFLMEKFEEAFLEAEKEEKIEK